jgi:hypothetical protein
MRHFQKPVENSSSEPGILAALIEGLSPERRRELIGAAAQSRMLEIIDAHQGETVEAFLRAVQADAHWAILKDLPLSDVITLESDSAVEKKPDATEAAPSAPAVDPRQMQLPNTSIASAATAAPASPLPRGKKEKRKAAAPSKVTPATRKSGGDVTDDVMMAVTLEPGLRSEEIQKRLGKPALLVKAALAALRKNKSVRTEGTNRATRYFAPTK